MGTNVFYCKFQTMMKMILLNIFIQLRKWSNDLQRVRENCSEFFFGKNNWSDLELDFLDLKLLAQGGRVVATAP